MSDTQKECFEDFFLDSRKIWLYVSFFPLFYLVSGSFHIETAEVQWWHFEKLEWDLTTLHNILSTVRDHSKHSEWK